MKTIELYREVKESSDKEALLELMCRAHDEDQALLCLQLLCRLVKNSHIYDPVCIVALTFLKHGYSMAIYRVSYGFSTGSFGITADATKAEMWKEKSKELDGLAIATRLALIYEFHSNDESAELDRKMYWHFAASDLGNTASVSMYTNLYLRRHATEADFDSNPNQLLLSKIIELNIINYNLGFDDAAINVAFLFQIRALKGHNTDVDDYIWWLPEAKVWIKEAVRWLKIAVEERNALAAFNLGMMHQCGALDKENGMQPNIKKAIQWFAKAYELGGKFGSFGAYQLSVIYRSSPIDNLNYEIANEWHNKFVSLSKNNPPGSADFSHIMLLNLYCTIFTSPGSLRKHYLKHGRVLGCRDVYEYQEKAYLVLRRGQGILYNYKNSKSTAYIEEQSSGEILFVATNDNDRIKTCHLKSKEDIDRTSVTLPQAPGYQKRKLDTAPLPTLSFGFSGS